MEVLNINQRTDEWFSVRSGIPTASGFEKILSGTGKASTQSALYLRELVAEANGWQKPRFGSYAMDRGTELEPRAVAYYEFMTGEETEEVGFLLSECGRYGVSPDAMVGDRGGLEVKCPLPPAQITYLEAGKLPTKYRPQVYGTLHLTKLEFWDFFSFHPDYDPLLIRVENTDEEYLAWVEKWEPALEKFLKKLGELKDKFIKPVF